MTLTFAIGILREGGDFLAEKRGPEEEYNPGETIFPGGHIEEGESPEEALLREMQEELGIIVKEYSLLGHFFYDDLGDVAGASSFVFLVTAWQGKPHALEADYLVWVKDPSEVTRDFDRKLIKLLTNSS